MKRYNKSKSNNLQNNKPMLLSTTLKTCLSVGTVNLFHTGYTSCMDWASNISARSAATTVTGDVEHFRCISKNGDTLTA